MAINDGPNKDTTASSGDGGDSIDSLVSAVAGSDSGVRQFERVPVALGVTLDIGAHNYKTVSVDISETVVLIRNYAGDKLTVGDHLEVLIKGIIADDDVDEQLATMIVVRVDDDQIALVFDQDPQDE